MLQSVSTRLRTRAQLAAIGLALLTAGCSSHSSAPPAAASASAVKSTPVVAYSPVIVHYDPKKNARSALTTVGPCTQSGEDWVLRGNVTNTAQTARSYQIVIDYVTVPGDTVIATRIVDTSSVKPGATTTWAASAKTAEQHTGCFVRQVQANPAS